MATGLGIRQAGSCLVPVDQADMWVVWPDWLGKCRVWAGESRSQGTVTLRLWRREPLVRTIPPALSLALVRTDSGIGVTNPSVPTESWPSF